MNEGIKKIKHDINIYIIILVYTKKKGTGFKISEKGY